MIFKYTFISILGRTNVGKSTLFNKLIKKKISITSKKKNTTKKIILGYNKINNNEYIYLDNPGFNNYKDFIKIFHKTKNFLYKNNINKKINLIIIIIEKKNFFYEIESIKKINNYKIPIIILINKIDKIKNKLLILNFIKKIKNIIKYKCIIPVSIRKKKHIDIIQKEINKYLIKNKKYYNFKKIILYKKEFIIKEIIREKIYRLIGDEIPYLIKIKKKNILFKNKYIYIYYILIVKKKHNKIIIGKKGNKIKKIIKLSKLSINKYFKFKKKIKLYIKIIN